MEAERGPVPAQAIFDEDMCLGFQVFAAELELLASSCKGGSISSEELLPLLQKLQASVPRADKRYVKENQKMVEAILVDDVLLKAPGACATIRGLVASSIARIYGAGDTLPMYQRASSLMTYVAKEATNAKVDERVRLGAIELLAALFTHHGAMLTTHAAEAVTVSSKLAGKSGTDVPIRVALLRLAAAVIEGMNAADRTAAATQTDAWKLFNRCCRDKGSDLVRRASVPVLIALARAGGGVFWASSGGTLFGEAAKHCVAGFDDASADVREAYSTALGELAACCKHAGCQAAIDKVRPPFWVRCLGLAAWLLRSGGRVHPGAGS